MKEDNTGFFSQRTFNIFFSGVFIFIMAMLFKEKLETPDNYLEDVKNSKIYVEEKLVPPLKKFFKSSSLFEGKINRDNNSLRYALRFDNNEDLSGIVEKIEENGWIQYREDYQDKGQYLFCKDKYRLELGENRGSTFVTIEFSKSSPCWNFEETLKDDFYQLVE